MLLKSVKNSSIDLIWPVKDYRGFLSSWDTAAFINVRKDFSALNSLYSILSDTSIICNRILSLREFFMELELECILLTLKWTYFIISHYIFLYPILKILSLKKLCPYFIIVLRLNHWLTSAFSFFFFCILPYLLFSFFCDKGLLEPRIVWLIQLWLSSLVWLTMSSLR